MNKRIITLAILPVILCGCANNNEEDNNNVKNDFLDKVIQMEAVDSSYKTNVPANKGKIVTKSYTFNGKSRKAKVYLPYNYDSGSEYDTFYLMHGTGGNETSYIQDIKINTILDNMIEAKEVKPIIVVMPTWDGLNMLPAQVFSYFPDELEYLVEEIDNSYKTFSGDNKRDHRLVGGFSLGGITAWSTLVRKFDLFKNYLSMSGYIWENSSQTSAKIQEKNVKTIDDAITASSYDDYLIYNYYGGEDDFVHDYSYAQMEAMYQSGKFNFDKIVVKECASLNHDTTITDTYIIDALKNIFPNQ